MPAKVVDLNKIIERDTLKGKEFKNLKDYINKELTIIGFRILPSEFFDNEFIILDIQDKDDRFLLSVSSAVLLKQFKEIEKEYGNKDIIIKAKIVELESKKGRKYYSLEPIE